jgi:hypothetical protein
MPAEPATSFKTLFGAVNCRSLIMKAVDSDFYNEYIMPTMTARLKAGRGHWGFLQDVASNLMNDTVPSDTDRICNLGRPRWRLEAIQIHTKSCYVQVTSAPGSGYHLYMRTSTGWAAVVCCTV